MKPIILEKSKKPLSDAVFHDIRELIEIGELLPGSKVSEISLANKLNVSRAPVRDAMVKLQSCGLVERQLNVGARVVTLSVHKLIDIYHIRERMEGLAARFCAENISRDGLDRLQGLLLNQGKNIEEMQIYYQKGGDLDIHYLIVNFCNNKHLIKLFNESLYYLIRVYRFQFGMRGSRIDGAYQEHKAVIDAIGNGDGEMAEMLMRQHIRSSRKSIERKLEQGGFGESRKII